MEVEIKEGLQFTIPQGDKQTYSIQKVNYEKGVCQLQLEPEGILLSTSYSILQVTRLIYDGKWKVLYTPPSNLTNLFSTLPHNVVMTALEECAKDWIMVVDGYHRKDITPAHLVFGTSEYLAREPQKEIVEKLADKIYELGYQITPKP